MHFSLRLFSLGLLGLSFLQCTTNEKHSNVESGPTLALLVGTYTGNGSDGIYRVSFNANSGRIGNKELVATTSNPSYLTISKDRTMVFAVNENEEGSVSSFAWNANKTQLELVSKQPSEGSAPCYTEINSNRSLIAAANYSTGNIALFKVSKEGALLPAPSVKQHTGNGPFLPNQDGPHAHCVRFSEDSKFLYAVDLGNDKILSYPIINGELGDEQVALALDPGDGPRHLIFHPTKSIAFIVNELSSTVVSASVNTQTGEFIRISKLSALPNDFKGESYCADIHISGDGRFLYASNRGHNSLAIFKVSHDGELERIGIESVHGNWPRNFTLSPNEQFVLVANQKSNDITVFNRNVDSGLLKYTGHTLEIDRPVCLKF